MRFEGNDDFCLWGKSRTGRSGFEEGRVGQVGIAVRWGMWNGYGILE